MVVIGRMSTAKNFINQYKIDEVWCIVRSLKTMPYFGDVPVFHVPDLSPSKALFHSYYNWTQNGQWNQETFIKEYVPWFLKDMHTLPSRKMLNALFFAQKQKNILLLCFCPDETICHRSIIAGLLQGAGANVICERDYSHYYREYKAL